MFEAKAKLFTKENNARNVRRYAETESILHGRQDMDGVWKNAETLLEFIWFSLCYHFSYKMNWYDFALCIDNNDHQMTFVGNIVYLCLS